MNSLIYPNLREKKYHAKKPGRNQIVWEKYLPAQTRHVTMAYLDVCPKIAMPFSILEIKIVGLGSRIRDMALWD